MLPEFVLLLLPLFLTWSWCEQGKKGYYDSEEVSGMMIENYTYITFWVDNETAKVYGGGNALQPALSLKFTNVTNTTTANSTRVYSVGINKKDPQCELDVADICAVNVTLTNLNGQSPVMADCSVQQLLCDNPFNMVINLTSVLETVLENIDTTIVPDPLKNAASFGYSVDVELSALVTGAPTYITDGGLTDGSLFVFQRYIYGNSTIEESNIDVNIKWIQTQQLRTFDTTVGHAQNARLGESVAILLSENLTQIDWIAGGAPFEGPNNRGCVYLYRYNETVTMFTNQYFSLVSPHTKLEASDEANNARFGRALKFVRFPGNPLIALLVSSEQTTGHGANTGAIYVYTFNTSNIAAVWTFKEKKSCVPTVSGAKCGYSLDFALLNSTWGAFYAGAPLDTPEGKVFVYTGNNDVGYTQQSIISYTLPGTAVQRFGWFVSIDTDQSQYLCVGAPYAQASNGDSQGGAVVIFNRTNLNPITFNTTSPDILYEPLDYMATGNQYGTSGKISPDGTRLLVGSPYFGTSINDVGIAYQYTLEADEIWSTSRYLTYRDPTPTLSGLFAFSLDTDNQTNAIGEPGDLPQLGFKSGSVQLLLLMFPLSYIRYTQCIIERGVLSNIINYACSFDMQEDIPFGFYSVTTNTSILNINSTQICNTFYQFGAYAQHYQDPQFLITFFSPSIPAEDVFLFYFLTRSHTECTVTMLAKVVFCT